MSGARAFFDTNVLLYAHGSDAGKRAIAAALLREHEAEERILVSTQVIQEFYAAGARKLAMAPDKLRHATVALFEWPLVIISPGHIMAAMEMRDRYQISFWDGLILAAAESGGAEILYTEDLNDGQRYGAVEARNPFRAASLPR
jgi:predicted nucleic acid-binding protein